MSLSGEHVLLRIYLQSADRSPHTPTYERVVKAARAEGLAGCTVVRGIMGFGARGMIPPPGFSLTEHVPVIVEIADSASQISKFTSGALSRLMPRGIATLERAHVLMQRARTQLKIEPLQLGPLLVTPLSTIPWTESGDEMTTNQTGVLLRIFIGESDRTDGKPLHEAILHQARQLGLAGATVLRGVEGFGANSVIHKSKLLEMSSDLPIVIEMVDAEDKIRTILPYLEKSVREGMITMEHVAIISYRHNPNCVRPSVD